MPQNPIIFLETDFDTLEDAIATSQAQVAQLTQQGILFTQQVLFRATDGCRVFVINIEEPEDIQPQRGDPRRKRVKVKTDTRPSQTPKRRAEHRS